MPYYSHRCRALWAMSDDRSDFGRVILGRLENIIRGRLGDAGLPVHKNVLVNNLPCDTAGLWEQNLSTMVVPRAKTSIMDRLRVLQRAQCGSELALAGHAHMLFQAGGTLAREG